MREALRELESSGLVQRRPGSKLMSVSRPQQRAWRQASAARCCCTMSPCCEVWEALTILEPPIAEAAARARTAEDLERLAAAASAFAAVQRRHGRGRAAHRRVLPLRRPRHPQSGAGLAQEPLLQLLEPSLRVMIDKVPQARARIATAHRRLLEALQARDADGAHDWMARHIRDFRKGYEIAGIDLALRLTL